MDYDSFSNRVLTFSDGSVSGSTSEQCTNVMINNDDVLEPGGEMFSVVLTSAGADIATGRGTATLTIMEDDLGSYINVYLYCRL